MRFEDFEIVRPLGRGAFGTVYLAKQPITRRLVAVKLLDRVGEITDRNRRHFERECVAMATLSHPNVVTIFEADVRSDGVPFLVLEYMAGGTLADRVPMPVNSALDAIVEAAAGVEYAHGKGLIHRDIKPLNLLVSDADRVKVGDFGIALLGDHLGTSLDLTYEQAAGTMPYMAPELFIDDVGTISTDVYALGATLHELLTGQPPFVLDTDRGPAPLMRRILDDPLPPLPTSVPPLVAKLIQRTLSKTGEQRPRSATDFADQVRSIQETLRKVASKQELETSRSGEPPIPGVNDEASLRARADSGDPEAMVSLGVLLNREGRIGEAETWYRQAADLGDTDAMNNLGAIRHAAGRLLEAEALWRQAADLGNAFAMTNVGSALWNRGLREEAEDWWRKGRDHGF